MSVRVARLALCTIAAIITAAFSVRDPRHGRHEAAPSGYGPPALRDRIRAYRVAHEGSIVRELAELVAIPNVARDSAGIRRNVAHLSTMLERRGFQVRELAAEGGSPPLLAELRVPGARRTIVVYAHYDGQPVDPAAWATPPWTPVLRDASLEEGGRERPLPTDSGARVGGEWRLYGRSASDDKAPIVALLTAVDALRAQRIPLTVNLALFLDGEEEAGSPHLNQVLAANADLLRADLWLFADGPVHQSRRPQVVFGARGVMGLELTLYGPLRPLHSGHYGNWAPNPATELAHLLSGMRDDDGRVLIDGFYDDVTPVSAADRAALHDAPQVDDSLRRALGIARSEGNDAPLAERIMLPALNVRGISAGRVGNAAANAIPTEATASIDFRLVPAQRPERVRALVEEHLRRHRYWVVHDSADSATRASHARVVRLQWEAGYRAVRTPLDLPVSRAIMRIVGDVSERPPVTVPLLGGSLPLASFEDALHVPVIVLPIVNHDNNQHAANENVRMQNVWDGIELFGAVLARLGTEWP
ncbi:MAG TPA: M20/M25/M40 family metallo-hydrolase [Gemmatimonadaceae bacterium]|nr:M20/M25/M40 family metallo-hydrolase [Gemmatimonadaceae bacterium]